MASVKPGDYITAKCRRCDDITGHVVMLVLGGEVAKVECKACGSVHKYRETARPSAGVQARSAVRRVKAGQSREEALTVTPDIRPEQKPRPAPQERGHFARAAKQEAAWQEAMLRHSGETAKPYGMNAVFVLRDLVEHSVFGLGEVIEITRPDKMSVLFQEGVKVLRCKTA